MNKSENERSGVLSTTMSFLGLYRDPVVAAVTRRCDWRISDLVEAESPTTLYQPHWLLWVWASYEWLGLERERLQSKPKQLIEGRDAAYATGGVNIRLRRLAPRDDGSRCVLPPKKPPAPSLKHRRKRGR